MVAKPTEVIEDNLSDVQWEASRHFRNKKYVYLTELTSLNQRVRIRTSQICTGASMNLRKVTNLQLIY
jgi:hypothetical protein